MWKGYLSDLYLVRPNERARGEGQDEIEAAAASGDEEDDDDDLLGLSGRKKSEGRLQQPTAYRSNTRSSLSQPGRNRQCIG